MPFAGYKDFDECVRKNKDKKDPEAYCAEIKRRVEKFVQSPSNFTKGGVGSGIKGHTTAKHLVPKKPPNPEIMEGLKNFPTSMFGGDEVGRVDSKEGTFEFTKTITTGDKKEFIKEKFRLEDRTFILESDGTKVTVPKRHVSLVVKWFKNSNTAIFNTLIKMDKGDLKDQHNNLMKDFSESRKKLKLYDSYTPEFEDIDSGKGKYSARMNLKGVKNQPHVSSHIPYMWYSGNSLETSIIGEATQAIVTGNMDKDDLYQGPLSLIMEASRKTNENHHTDFIYRGETNIEEARALVKGIVAKGEVSLADKLFSTSESEKLGKWYAVIHSQRTARQTYSKTGLMLKIPYDKYKNNVALDYKVSGSNFTPEREISIFGNGIKLTGDDIMIRATTPSRKKSTWMTLSKFIQKDGDVEGFINSMWESKDER